METAGTTAPTTIHIITKAYLGLFISINKCENDDDEEEEKDDDDVPVARIRLIVVDAIV